MHGEQCSGRQGPSEVPFSVMAQLSHVNAWQCAPSAVSLRKTPQPFLGARVPIVTPRIARRYPRCLECWTATPSVASTRCGKQSHAGACRTGAARGMASWRPLTPELGRRSRRCLACLVRAIVCPPGGTAISHNTSRAGPCLPQLCRNGLFGVRAVNMTNTSCA